MATDPSEIWALIARADDLVKYGANRDPADAAASARALLDEAEALIRGLEDEGQSERLEKLIALRRADLARYPSDR